jgi:hypothetical protein
MANPNAPAQTQFIQKLKESIPANHSLVEEMADLLEISTDSAYRRIRGETALTIDEVTRLCSHYRIPFDFTGADGEAGSSVTFTYNHLSSDIRNFEEYLGKLSAHMKQIKAADPKEIIWAAEDVPIFHHFRYPALTAFKLFYWSKSILNVPEFENKKFGKGLVPEKPMERVQEIYDLYNSIPSIEIWSEDTINSTLKQVEYYSGSGLFESTADALEIIGEVETMINSIEKQAAYSLKFSGEAPEAGSTISFQLFFSDLMIGNNTIMTRAGNSRVTYISLNTFNSMATTSVGFNEETDRWMRNLIRKSNLISGVSEKQRFRFFKMMRDKIAKTKERINSEE